VRVERPVGIAGTVERLWGAARAGRLPHALSFEGPEGIGKFQAAKWLALGLLCERGPGEPCRTCGACKRVLSGGHAGNHPDLLVVDPVEEDSETIRVSWIARRATEGGDGPALSLEVFLDLRAHEGRGRPVLIREAQRMNAAAQNALLKTLEEPRAGTLLVLETHRPEQLLPTIKSRCVRVAFRALDPADALEVLGREGLEPEAARVLARLSGGSPGLALQLAARGATELRALVLDVLGGRRSAAEVASAAWAVEGEFSGNTPTAKARDRARVFLDLAAGVLADARRLAAGRPEAGLAHGDVVAPLVERLGVGLDGGGWSTLQHALLEARADVDRNVGTEALVARAARLLAEAGQVPVGVRG